MCQWLRFAACSCCQWVLCILRICACPGASSCNLCPNGTYATALGAKRHCIVWQGAVAGRDSGIRQAKTLSMYLCLTVIAYSYSSPPYFRLILIIEPLESIVHLIIRYFLAAADYFYCIMLNFIINILLSLFLIEYLIKKEMMGLNLSGVSFNFLINF